MHSYLFMIHFCISYPLLSHSKILFSYSLQNNEIGLFQTRVNNCLHQLENNNTQNHEEVFFSLEYKQVISKALKARQTCCCAMSNMEEVGVSKYLSANRRAELSTFTGLLALWSRYLLKISKALTLFCNRLRQWAGLRFYLAFNADTKKRHYHYH